MHILSTGNVSIPLYFIKIPLLLNFTMFMSRQLKFYKTFTQISTVKRKFLQWNASCQSTSALIVEVRFTILKLIVGCLISKLVHPEMCRIFICCEHNLPCILDGVNGKQWLVKEYLIILTHRFVFRQKSDPCKYS